jgi:hypothetical protein
VGKREKGIPPLIDETGKRGLLLFFAFLIHFEKMNQQLAESRWKHADNTG